MSCVLLAGAIAVFGATVAVAVRSSLSGQSSFGIVFLAAFGGIVLAGLFDLVTRRLTRPFCVRVPAGISSIRDMIPYAVTSARLDGWTRDEVSAVVRRLVIEQLGLAESEYTEDSNFTQDFRLD